MAITAQRVSRSALQIVTSVALLALAACASRTSDRTAQPPRAQPPPPPSQPKVDPSYDWHVLVLAPFGMLLKESPMPLHEVLVFHDESHASVDAESKDCFGIDRQPPRFIGTVPDPYLLCFDHDRLSRVEASVRLSAQEAPQIFATACSIWRKTIAPAPAPVLSDSNFCEGRDGSTAFNSHLVLTPGETTATVSLTLSKVSGADPHAP